MKQKKKFNKLVRDKIIKQIKASGREVDFKVLSKKEYVQALKNKLQEEVDEFRLAKNSKEQKQELADVMEVVSALKAAIQSGSGEIKKIKKQKRKQNGAFKKRLFLITATIA